MKYEKSSIGSKIAQASEYAELAPEKYRQAAFSALLSLFLNDTDNSTSTPYKPIQKQERAQKASDFDLLDRKYDWSSTNIGELDGIAQYLAVIKIALEEFQIDGLSAKQVNHVLFQKFRISKSINTVSMGLMAAVGKHVDRIKDNNEYIYRITKRGLEFLASTGKVEK